MTFGLKEKGKNRNFVKIGKRIKSNTLQRKRFLKSKLKYTVNLP